MDETYLRYRLEELLFFHRAMVKEVERLSAAASSTWDSIQSLLEGESSPSGAAGDTEPQSLVAVLSAAGITSGPKEGSGSSASKSG